MVQGVDCSCWAASSGWTVPSVRLSGAMIAYNSRRSVCGNGTAKRSSILSLVLGNTAVTMPDRKEAPSTRTLVPTFMLWPCRYEKIATTKRLSQSTSDASVSPALTCRPGPAPMFRMLPAPVTPDIGLGQSIQSLLLGIYETLVIFQHRGSFFFLDFHSLFVEVDVPPLLDEGADGDEIISHIDAFSQGIELCDLLIELRAFGIRIVKRGRILVSGRLEHIHARGVACDHVGLPLNQRFLCCAQGVGFGHPRAQFVDLGLELGFELLDLSRDLGIERCQIGAVRDLSCHRGC